MKTLTFYDLKKRKKFESNNYKIVTKKTKVGIRYFAKTTAPSGVESQLIVSKDFYTENK